MNWRIETKQKRTAAEGVRPYRVLVRGKDAERVSLSLGYVTEADAAGALAAMQAAEDGGRIGAVLALHREDPAGAVAYLVGDPGVREVLAPAGVDYAALTLREYFDDVYKAWRAADRPATWRTERTHWRRILEALGTVRLRRVDARTVADYLDGLLVVRRTDPRCGEPVAGATKRLHRAAIKALLLRAERLGHLATAPDLGRYKIRDSTRRVRTKVDPLDLDDLAALLAVADPKHRALFAVAVGQGLRPGELARIRWEDVDFDARTLAVRGTKTAASADTIPLTPIAHRELRAWWTACGEPVEGVAIPGRGGRAYGAGGYRKSLETAATAAGISRKVTPYLLRHSFATIAWCLGIDKDVTRRIGRWTNDRMIETVYCRPRPADLVARVKAFDL